MAELFAEDRGARPDPAWLPADHDVRRRIVECHDRPLVVEAGAGTGKTTLLVARVLHALEHGLVEMPGVVAISFTEKAAAELRLRLRQALEARLPRIADDAIAEARLRRAVSDLHRAQISTIHALASGMLRECPAEARLEPQFRVLDELEALQLQRAFWRRWVDAELEDDHGAALLRAVLQAGVRLDPDLANLVRALYDNRDLAEVVRLPHAGGDLEARMRALRQEVQACLRHAQDNCLDRSDKGYAHIESLALHLDALEDLAPAGWAAVFLQGLRIDAQAGRRDHWKPGAIEASKTQRLAARARLQAVHDDLVAGVLRRSLLWCRRFLVAFADEKRRLGVVDFQDLLLYARNLVRDDLGVRRDLGRRMQMLCVDEFQDTDPLQAELVLYLGEREGPAASQWQDVRVGSQLFLVGDPKQSIYRFRRADLDVYMRCCNLVIDSGGEVLDIVQNFRSRPVILHWVNGVFASLFDAGAEQPPQPRHVPLVPMPETVNGPTVWIARPGAGAPAPDSADAGRRAEARALVALVARALDEGWMVRGDAGPRRLQPGDVALLFARTSGIEHYEDALRAARLPFRQEGGKLFFQRQEIRDVLHALAAIDDPGDELALVAALRSPLFGMSDAELWQHRQRHASFDYLSASTRSPLQSAFRTLAALHAERHRRGLGGTAAQLLVRTAAHAVYAAQPQGDRALGNFATLLRRARAFEHSRPAGLRDFVLALRDLDDESPRLSEWTPEEENPEQVRLLTVHMAKGLEFPCVVLANLTARGNPQHEPIVYDRAEQTAEIRLHATDLGASLASPEFEALAARERERERAEEKRLLYVAATRARDYLIVGDFAGKRAEGLLKMLRQVPGALGEGAFGSLPPPLAAGIKTPATALWCIADAADVAPPRPPATPAAPAANVVALHTARRAWPAAHAAIVERGHVEADWIDVEEMLFAPGSKEAALEKLLHAGIHPMPAETDTESILTARLHEAAMHQGTVAQVENARKLVLQVFGASVLARARAARAMWTGVRLTAAFAATTLTALLDLVFEEENGCVLVDCTATAREAVPAEARARALTLRALLLRRSGRCVREAGTLFLASGIYECLDDVAERLEALERELGAGTAMASFCSGADQKGVTPPES